MAWELIYTSAPRGLLSGQSGFCTVARSSGLREALVLRIEQLSSYHHLEVSGASAGNPTISAYRILEIRGTTYHVLTRIQPCGLDFTARTNHLAHHLVFAAEELAQLPSPAVILLQWPGWLNSWQGEPRERAPVPAASFGSLRLPGRPGQAWLRGTGDAGRAAGLLESQFARGCYLLCPPAGEQELLELFAETLQLLNPRGVTAPRAWQHTFTTFLQGEDDPADFQWRGCREGTPGAQQALRRSTSILPLAALPVPKRSEAALPRPALKSALSAPSSSSAPPPKPSRSLPTARKAPVSQQPSAPSSRPWDSWSEPEPEEEPAARSETWLWVAMALIILAGVLLFFYLSRKNAPLPAQTPATNLVATVPAPAIDQLASSNVVVPAQVEVVKEPPIQKQQDEERRKRELDADLQVLNGLRWQDTPIYLVVTDSMAEPIPLEGIGPLTDLFRKLAGLDLAANVLDLRYHLSGWKMSDGVQMRANADSAKVLRAKEDRSKVTIEFDYSDVLQREPVRVCSSNQNNFTVLFSTTNLPPSKAQTLKAFRLMVVSVKQAPEPLRLSRSFLNPNAQRWPETLVSPLRNRLEQFHLAGGATNWQLRPFVGTNPAKPKDLYLLPDGRWPPEQQPPFGAELDFAATRQHLEEVKTYLNTLLKDPNTAAARKYAADLNAAALNATKVADDQKEKADRLEKEAAESEKAATDRENEVQRLKQEALELRDVRSRKDEKDEDYSKRMKDQKERAVAKDQQLKEAQMPEQNQQRAETVQKLRNQAKEKKDAAQSLRDKAADKVVEGAAKGSEAASKKQNLDAIEASLKIQIRKVEQRLAAVPDSVERAAYVSLFAVGPNMRVEVVRFIDEAKGSEK